MNISSEKLSYPLSLSLSLSHHQQVTKYQILSIHRERYILETEANFFLLSLPPPADPWTADPPSLLCFPCPTSARFHIAIVCDG